VPTPKKPKTFVCPDNPVEYAEATKGIKIPKNAKAADTKVPRGGSRGKVHHWGRW
jgi:hypothetical protein